MIFPSPRELEYVLRGGLAVTRARIVQRLWYGFKLLMGKMFLWEGEVFLMPGAAPLRFGVLGAPPTAALPE